MHGCQEPRTPLGVPVSSSKQGLSVVPSRNDIRMLVVEWLRVRQYRAYSCPARAKFSQWPPGGSYGSKDFPQLGGSGGRSARCLHILANMDIYQPSTSINLRLSWPELALNWGSLVHPYVI